MESPLIWNSIFQADSMAWCQVCFGRRLEGFEIAPELENAFAHHAGTPPTTSLIKSLNDNQVRDGNTLLN